MLEQTRADAVMIGRAAQGRPWIFREIAHFLATGQALPPPSTAQVRRWLVAHLHDHYALYGEDTGVRSARKHIGWALRGLPGGAEFRDRDERHRDLRGTGRGGRRMVRLARRAASAAAGE